MQLQRTHSGTTVGERPPRRPMGGGARRFGSRKREPIFTKEGDVDYKEIARLRRCLDERGRILPRRRLGHTAQVQRLVTVAIKRARHVALLPFDQRDDRR
jgi:small subunit ribosomal protein S18